MKNHLILIDTAKCIGCGLCREDCPAGNIAMVQGKAVIQKQGCIQCGHCVAICPKGAVFMEGFDDEPVELMGGQPKVDPDSLLNALRARRSIRKFQNKPIDGDTMAKIIEAGRWTPTAKNAQGVSYIVLQQGLRKYEALAVAFFKKLVPWVKPFYPAAKRIAIDDNFFFKKAPAALLIVADNKVDGALAASNMALMAEGLGLGVLYSGFFTIAANYSPALRRALGLKASQVATTLVLGHPAVSYARTAPKERPTVRPL